MRLIRLLTSAGILIGVALTSATTSLAGAREGSAAVSVSVSLSGFETPSQHWQDPCEGNDPYTGYESKEAPIPVYRDEATEIAVRVGLPADFERNQTLIDTYGPDVFRTFVSTHTRFTRYCYDPLTRDVDPGTFEGFWVPLVTQETVVAALAQRLEDYLRPPRVSWPSVDREFGWLYVKAPMDFRVDDVSPISLTASVTNITGSVTATVSATPSSVLLEPGEPGGSATTCPMAAATAAYVVSTPGLCSYRYNNSSAVSPSGTFNALASVAWTIVTSDPGFGVATIRTWSSFDVAVAEAQAVVTG